MIAPIFVVLPLIKLNKKKRTNIEGRSPFLMLEAFLIDICQATTTKLLVLLSFAKAIVFHCVVINQTTSPWAPLDYLLLFSTHS